MPKRRRTRREKERLQQKRSMPSPEAESNSAPMRKSPPKKVVPGKVDGDSQLTAVTTDEDTRRRIKLMKYSLLVFGVLVLFQLAVWLSAQTGVLPSDWVEILVS